MTIKDTDKFYKHDNKNYEISKNKEFLYWLKNSINNGYDCFVTIEEMQELINYIVNWYEIKYPEREFELYEGIRNTKFSNIQKISEVMDIEQLFYRLPHKQLCLMECNYRSKFFGQHPIYENGKIIDWKTYILINIDKKNIKNKFVPYFIIIANYITGEVINIFELKEYIEIKEKTNLIELLNFLNKKYIEELDFTELKKIIYNYECDLELRYRILQLIALNLLYSKNTIPERGYGRAKRFIAEFNKKLNLNLSTTEIDNAINMNYVNEQNSIPSFDKDDKNNLIEMIRKK